MGNFHTLIVYDFDDTLFPTTYFQRRRYNLRRRSRIPADVRERLVSLEQSVIELLNESKRHGIVKIVSNGSLRWVVGECQEYMPNLWTYIIEGNVEVISAYDDRNRRDQNPAKWKRDAFLRLLRDINSRCICPCLLRFLSVGDGDPERTAALSLSNVLHTSKVRVVKFNAFPTLAELDRRVQKMKGRIAEVLRYNGHVTVDM